MNAKEPGFVPIGQQNDRHQVEPSRPTDSYENCVTCCGNVGGCLQNWICCCFCPSPYKIVEEGKVGVVQKFGKFAKLYAPGLYYVNPCTEKMVMVDKREKILDVRGQICVTKDNVNVIIDAVVYYQVEDSYKSLFSVDNLVFAISELCQTSLRDVMGKVTLQQALEDRDSLAGELQILLDDASLNWGVDISKCLIQEILFTDELKKSLSTAATAKRLAESKIIGAQADVQAAKLMRTASELLDTPAAMQVRYLEALTSVAKAANPKVVFFPSDFKKVGTE